MVQNPSSDQAVGKYHKKDKGINDYDDYYNDCNLMLNKHNSC